MAKPQESVSKQRFRPALFTLLYIIFIGIIVYLWYSSLPKAYSIALAVVSLIVGGELMIKSNSFSRVTYGIYLARSRLGLGLMDRIASNNSRVWNWMSDWGLVMGFGLFSLVLFKKDISKKTVAMGVISVVLMLTLVLPFTLLPFSYINIPQITSRVQGMAPYGNLGAISMVGVALLIAAALGGFVLFMIIALAYGAGLAVYGVLLFAITSLTTVPNTTGLSNSIPGVAPLIPGITLPLAQGLLAFILILVVHEFSHGVLARISKVKVKSSGFIGIGVVPIGAFVEPDEKQISKLSRKLQNRISVAGMSANLLFCLITFVPTILMFYYVMPHTLQTYTYIEYVVPNSPAYNAHLMAGSTLLSWNGHPTSNVTDMEAAAKGDAPDSMVSVATNVSTYSIIANQTGKIGVIVGEGQRLGGANPGPVVSFIYSFFALSFLLNFLIALVNFLPVPSFDGWRIFNTSIKNYKMVKYLSTFVILLVLLNALPWIWNL